MRLMHRRALVAVAVAALAVTGCTVPGQDGPAGVAASFPDGRDPITTARVAELSTAWEDTGLPVGRQSVVTLEILREPLLEAAPEIGLDYSRDVAEQQAELLLERRGIESEASEALLDNLEAAFLLAGFTFLPEDATALMAIADQIEQDAVTSPRTGDFTTEALIASITEVAPLAVEAANQGEPVWFAVMSGVNAFEFESAPWTSGE